ncbi:hypothetical protein BDQ17DRAFT_1363072 [Cyathus striatus]|nr:hypothetical protein BDQ17DRAFT_1363072 [Cyathus striatus]
MPPNILAFRLPILPLIIIFHSCAILSTAFRLTYRARFRQLWWDDFWAFFALINTILLFAAYIEVAFDLPQSWVSSFFVVMVTCRLALWASRLSVAVTIVRIIATGKSLLISKIMAVIFGLIGITIIVQKAIFCNPPGASYTCTDKSVVTGYTDLGTSFFADLWLLAAPTYFLWNMKLKKQVYRLIQAIFATEILVLATSIIHCVYIQRDDFQAQGVISYFKVTVSLIVCNLLFLVTYMYRQLRNGQEYTDETTTFAPSRKPSVSNTMTYSGQTQSSLMTSVYISSHPSSQPTGVDLSRILCESEPGIMERQWPSVGGIRGVITV